MSLSLCAPNVRRWAIALVCTAALGACGGGGGGGSTAADVRYGLVFDVVGADGVARLFRSDLSSQPAAPIHGGVPGVRAAPYPDGRSLVFAASEPGDPWSPPTLYWLDLIGGQKLALSSDADVVELEPNIAPDGQRLVYTSQRDDPGGDIMLARMEAGRLRDAQNLTPRATNRQTDPDRTPAWSPDGQWIAFTAYRDGSPALWVMDAAGGRARRVTPMGNWGDFSPSWSADGRTLAFQRVDTDPASGTLRSRIGMVPALGGQPVFLNLPHNAYDPRFSPEGGRLAYWAKTGDGGEIIIANLHGEEIRRINTPGVDRHPVWIRL
jgi:TolB protein